MNVKQNTSVHRFGAAKKCKAIRTCNVLWSSITNQRGNTKINAKVTKYLYDWFLHYPWVVQSPISNACLEVSVDDQTEKLVVPKLLLQV